MKKFTAEGNNMSIVISCYDCRFFSPGEFGCPSYEHDKELSGFMAEDEGICRRHPPRHGKTIKDHNGDQHICFAEWPKVMACDWCGEFNLRFPQSENLATRQLCQ